jgi:MFS family permease
MPEESLKTDREVGGKAPAAPSSLSPPPLGAAPPVSDWSPLRNPVFRALWLASAVSYIGYEIRNYAAPLLMGDFREPFKLSEGMVLYTFTASTLPIPLLVLFAGALADRADRRKLLIITHLWMMLAAGALGALTIGHLMTPWLMLGLLFAIGAGYAMMNPALLAVLPELVEPRELKSALALNSVNMNVARVFGPAIGGLIIVFIFKKDFYLGKGMAFLATALSLVGVVYVLARWKPAERKAVAPSESILGAVGTGVRYTFASRRLLEIMARIFLFMVFAGILATECAGICKVNEKLLWGETGAFIMMVFFGVGAILGVYLMQALQRRFGVEQIVFICTILYGAAMLSVAWMPGVAVGCGAMFVAGFNWVIVPTNFNIATQLAVPAWIKGRTMGMYVLVLWGSMSLGSLIFGQEASVIGQLWLHSEAGSRQHALLTWADVGQDSSLSAADLDQLALAVDDIEPTSLLLAAADIEQRSLLRSKANIGQRWALSTAGVGVMLGSVAIIWLRLVPKAKETT